MFGGSGALDEPVVPLPLAGRASFRQVGLIIGISVLLPLAVHHALSGAVLAAWPAPLLLLEAPGGAGQVRITWDMVLAAAPVPAGLALGLPRPAIAPMDRLLADVICFAVRGHSPGGPRRHARRGRRGSPLAGFAPRDPLAGVGRANARQSLAVGASCDGAPRNITVTLYGGDGLPLRNVPARAYLDGELLSTVATDPDGVMGLVVVPGAPGTRRLLVEADGMDGPAVDVDLEVVP